MSGKKVRYTLCNVIYLGSRQTTVVHLDAKHEVCDLGKEHVRGNVAEASAASVGVRLVGWLVDLGLRHNIGCKSTNLSA